MTEPQTEPNRANWSPPRDYPYAPTQNPNPGKQRQWDHEVTQQVEWLTKNLVAALDRIGELETKASKPPPKTVTTPKQKTPPKDGGGA